jgi:polyphosphate kinase
MKKKSQQTFINRELSWLEFNHRVLEEGLSDDLPLLERLKFLSIVSSNLDEFFMIRVAGLKQQQAAGIRKRDPSGMTPVQQLKAISRRVHRMVKEQSDGLREVLDRLRAEGLHLVAAHEWTSRQRKYLRSNFSAQILPMLTPLAVETLNPPPLLPGLALNVALLVPSKDDTGVPPQLIVIPVPGQVTRFISLPSDSGLHLAPLEEVVAAFAGELFPGSDIQATAIFRATRDADVTVDDDEGGDLLQTVEQAMLSRRRRAIVRLEVSATAPADLRRRLVAWANVTRDDVVDVDGILDAAGLMQVATRDGFDALTFPEWLPQEPRDLIGADDLWSAIHDRDILLNHPYESFNPVVQFVDLAADDPGVLAIKLTLYRTSGDSPIIRALERAAESGKQVTVLVELKARFDEQRNVLWARRLEDAGCHVIYGIAGYKTHSKALLVVRREAHRVRRYVHLATGNYNDKTARLYSDIGLMTCDNDIASDVAAFFNLLTGYSEAVGWSKLTIAPTGLRQRFIDLIDREIRSATADHPGLIMAKVNSLQDPGIIEALYRAGQAGVTVKLNVRGICCLRPGVKGLSENIDVTSIVDRYLEHARVFYFHNGGHNEVYMSSADWMRRNLDRRLEIMFPVMDRRLRRRVTGMLKTLFADNVKARRLLPDGTYGRVPKVGKVVRAQEQFYREAVEAARSAKSLRTQFRPMTRPEA